MTEIDSRQGVEKLNTRKSRILLKETMIQSKGYRNIKTHEKRERERERERENKLHTY